MSERPFIAARVEDWINRLVESFLRVLGWRETIVPYTGYGSEDQLRVLARIVLTPPRSSSALGREVEQLMQRRGWRNFIATGTVRTPARVRINGKTLSVRADRGGYLDVRVPNPGLEPGWQAVEIVSRLSEPVTAPLIVVGKSVKFGIVSDIDDTVMVTYLPRPMIAFWNAFVLEESARQPIEGMAEMYRTLLDEHPGAPVFYLSTGAWDTVPFLSRFLERHDFPTGPLLLTDWGPTNTGWFRSGQEHKRRALRDLARDFPKIKWVLIGDDGQHDPALYNEFASHLPKKVRAIGIRQLSPAEQVLSHGLPTPIEDEDAPHEHAPEVRAGDGHGLLDLLRPILDRKKKREILEPEGLVAPLDGKTVDQSGKPAADSPQR